MTPRISLPSLHKLDDSIERLRTATGSALAVRVLVLVFGFVVLLSPERQLPFPTGLTFIGTLLGVFAPRRSGSALALLGGIGGWLACYGLHASPPADRVLGLAVALYLLHSSIALAAAVPVTATLDLRTARRWSLRCLLHLAIAGILLLAGYLLRGLFDRVDGQLLDTGAVLGIAAILATALWLFSRSPR